MKNIEISEALNKCQVLELVHEIGILYREELTVAINISVADIVESIQNDGMDIYDEETVNNIVMDFPRKVIASLIGNSDMPEEFTSTIYEKGTEYLDSINDELKRL